MKNRNVLKYQDMKGSKLVSFRMLLVALWMMVCGSTSVFAIQSGDVVTIRSYAEANHYLTLNAGNNGVEDYHGTTPTEKSLWRILQNGNGYAFESVAAPGNYLYAHMTQQNNAEYGDMYELHISKTISSFYYIQNVNGTVGRQEENTWVGGMGCTNDASATSRTNRYIRYKSSDSNPWGNLGRPNATVAPVVVLEKWIDEDEGGNENEGGQAGLPFGNGDTITVSYKNGNTYNYLAASKDDNSTVNKNEVDNYCLWKVTIRNGEYSFTNVADSKKSLVVEIERDPSYTKYLRTALDAGFFTISEASTKGLYYLRYDLGAEDKADFVRYHYKSLTWGIGSSENRSLTFEKWSGKEEEVVDASIKNGDVITISYKNGDTYNYLAANANDNAIVNKTTEDAYCLWTVAVNASGQYSFTNVGDPQKVLGTEGEERNLLTNTRGSVFRLEESSTKGLYHVRYTYVSSEYDYVRYHHQNLVWGIGGSDYRKLTLEKWTKKGKKGELQGVFTQGNVDVSLSGVKLDKLITDLNNGEVGNDGAQEVTLTITRGAEDLYYQCVGRNVRVTVGKGAVTEADVNLSAISCAWSNSGNEVSSTNCSNYKDATVENRGLLHVRASAATKTNTSVQYRLTISPVGSSPMDLKNADGTRWIDYTDNMVVTFIEDGTTYRELMSVTRYSYHKEVLPELDVKVNPTSHTFLREGESQNFAFSCVHQHGASVRHMYDMVADNRFNKETMIYEIEPETLALTNNKLTVSFALENASWISKGTLSNNILPLTAQTNNTGQQRDTKLVGTFKYMGQDTHEKVIEIPLSQNAKTEGTVFHHQKGIANTTFGLNPHTNQEEQKVHTAEKTIYYLPETNVKLILPGKTFLAYQRWYDYATDCDPQYNINENDRTTWSTAPKGIGINPQVGRSFGIYDIDTTITIVAEPVLKTWKYNKSNLDAACHTIACDLSNYKDYTIVKQYGQTTSITEPTLSYRQLWHFRPAEEMAEKLDKCTGSTYLETHYYTAPVGTKINLITNYHHSLSDVTQNSYFYNKDNATRIAAANVTWYQGGQVMAKNYSTKDFQIVSSSSVGEVTYYLRASVSGKTLNIAKFVVRYVDKNKYGPTTREIISYNDIANKYDLLEEINFNYSPLPTSATKNTQINHPLPWGESTYGYYYPNSVSGLKYYRHSNRKDFNIPYYGEYALLNYMKADWATGTQHGGGTKGYALFVDGTEEPGLVANISTDAVVCSGQTMYCSMWLLNPRTSDDDGANPAFRCNIQGRNHGDEEWQDVGIFCTGEIVGHKGWHQVVFPIESDVTYDETRVSIYNFGTGGNGNDFMVDDICLYASALPLATYHNSTGCSFDAKSEKTSTVLVVRVDYSKLQFERDKYVYYQIVDVTDKASTIVVLKDAAGKSLYHREAADGSNQYGSMLIPTKIDNGLLRDNVETLIEELKQQSGAPAAKCFVKNPTTGDYYLYLVQLIPNGDGGKSDQYLDRDRIFELHVAYDADDLGENACVFSSPLHTKQDTYVQLRTEKMDPQRVTCETGLCANNQYSLEVKVQNAIAPTVGGNLYTKEAVIYADWLKGFAGDDVYCEEAKMTSQQKATADQAFMSNYGYSRTEVKNAIIAMRMIGGANFQVSNPNNLQVDAENNFGAEQLQLIRNLCNKGLLQLYKKTLVSYLGHNAAVRYWAYPISDTTTVLVEGKRYSLQGCNEPKWVKLQASESAYGMKFLFGEANQEFPTLRILEGVEDIQIPVQMVGKTRLSSKLKLQNGNVTFNTHTPITNALEYVSSDNLSVITAPKELVPGTKHLLRLTLYDENGTIVGSNSECGLGYAYFYLMTIPNKVEWTGAMSSEWDDDANWSAGCAPLPESNVVIPADGPYPVLSASKTSRTNSSSSSNKCNNVYFAPGAMLGDQHLLEYDKAFVDMRLTATTWHSMSAPLQGMYSGDMYIPHNKNDFNPKTTLLESTDTFAVSSFQGSRNSWAPYAFWLSVYNKRVPTYHENGALSYQESETAAFVPTNGMDHQLKPGTGYQLLGFGPTNTDEVLTIRLPKPDTHYSYYDSLGNETSRRVTVAHSHKLAFTPNASGVMSITLTNDEPSDKFMFGNPAMANINMTKFLEDNNLSPTYYIMENSVWNAENIYTMSSATGSVLPPMRSVLVQLQNDVIAKSCTLQLSVDHLQVPTTSTRSGGASQIAPRRTPSIDNETPQIMTIYALNDWGQARCVLAANSNAYDTYEHDEDALFISSGVEQGVAEDVATSPVNIYTVSEQVPMMIDVRENISRVPLGMLVHQDYVSETMRFVFYLSNGWSKECYLYDSQKDTRYRIMDGLAIELPAPANHEVRYYIEGPDESSNGGVTTSTTHPTESSANNALDIWAYSPNQGELVVSSNDILREVKVYDLSGRLIAYRLLDLHYNMVTMSVPAGLCIVEATSRDNTQCYIQTLVK